MAYLMEPVHPRQDGAACEKLRHCQAQAPHVYRGAVRWGAAQGGLC